MRGIHGEEWSAGSWRDVAERDEEYEENIASKLPLKSSSPLCAFERWLEAPDKDEDACRCSTPAVSLCCSSRSSILLADGMGLAPRLRGGRMGLPPRLSTDDECERLGARPRIGLLVRSGGCGGVDVDGGRWWAGLEGRLLDRLGRDGGVVFEGFGVEN